MIGPPFWIPATLLQAMIPALTPGPRSPSPTGQSSSVSGGFSSASSQSSWSVGSSSSLFSLGSCADGAAITLVGIDESPHGR